MGGLPASVVDVPFATLNQTPADHQGPLGRLTDLRNVVVEHYDNRRSPTRIKLRQRRGFVEMPTQGTDPDSGLPVDIDWDAPQLLTVLDDQLLSVAGNIPRVWNGTAWTAYGGDRSISNRLGEDVFHTSQSTIQAQDSAKLDGVTCAVWVETKVIYVNNGELAFDSPSPTVWIGFRGADKAWIIPPKVLYQPGSDSFLIPEISYGRVTQDGSRFWVVFNGVSTGDSKLNVHAYSTAGVLQASTSIDQNATPPGAGYWDIQALADGGVVVAQPLDGGGVELDAFTYNAGAIDVDTETDATMECSGPLGWITNDVDDLNYLATWNGDAGNTVFAYQIAELAQTHEYDLALTTVSAPDSLTGFVRAGGTDGQPSVVVSYTQLAGPAATVGPAYDPQTRRVPVNRCDWDGTTAFIRQANGVCQVGRAFKWNDDYLVPTYYQSGSGLDLTTRSQVVTITPGDYMIGAAEQPIKVAAGDYVTGSELTTSVNGSFNASLSMLVTSRQAATAISGAGPDKVEQIVSSGLGPAIPDGTPVLKWTFAASGLLGNTQASGSILRVAASSIASANADWDVIDGPRAAFPTPASGPVYTLVQSRAGGSVVPGNFTGTGTFEVVPMTFYGVPGLITYIDESTAAFLVGGTIQVSGLSGPGNNGTFGTVRAIVDTSLTYLSYGLGPGIWVPRTTQSEFEGVTGSGIVTPANANEWSFASNSFDDSVIGASLVVEGDSRAANNGTFEVTDTDGGRLVVDGTGLLPEIFGGTLPTATLVLPLDVTAYTFKFASLTLDYTYIGALVSISGSPDAVNNGTYTITQINADGTFFAVPSNGLTDQVNQLFTTETVTIYFVNGVAPVFQPCWFLTPINQEAYDCAQVGRFDYGLAYADWRIEANTPVNYFPLSLSSTVLDEDDGVQMLLPYRAQSFTAGAALVTPSGQPIQGAVSNAKSTVGLKVFTLHQECGTSVGAPRALILPGTKGGSFTASGFAESGYNVGPEAPFLVSQGEADGAALRLNGRYQVQVTFEMSDENGDRVFSIPSPPLDVTLTGDNNAATYGGRLPVPFNTDGSGVTKHFGVTDRVVGITVSRTSYQDNTPTTQHYRITDPLSMNGLAPSSTTNPSGFSFPDEFTWNYYDANPDVAILSQEVLYTDQRYLPRFPAPANRGGCTLKNREFVVGYDGAVWMSGELTPGDAPWFFPLFRFVFGDDTAVSCAGLDDYLVVQCERSLWYVPIGQGLPDSTGRNGALPTPIQLPFQNGGTGYAVTLKTGVAYSSTAGGVWIITRDLRNVWLSQPVQDDLTVAVTGMCVDADQRLHIATGTTAWFVYDQVRDCWYQWRLPTTSATLCAVLEGRVAWQDDARVARYSASVFADTVGAVTYGVPPDFALASMDFGNVRGVKVVWAIQIEGTYRGPHRVNAVLSYPGNNDNAPPTTFGPFLPASDQPYVLEINPMVEEASSYGLRVFVDFVGVADPGDSAEFELISCEVGIDRRPGLNNPVDSRRIGGR